MKPSLKWIFISILCLYFPFLSQAQDKEEEDKSSEYPVSKYAPLKLNVSEDGTKYIRFIIWNQIWAEDQDLSGGAGYRMRVRRSRLLAYAQISPRFLVLTHFGLNTLVSANQDPLGNRSTTDATANGPQLFLHAAWTEFKLTKNDALYMGGGLHYWNGLSRATSASTLNFMTQDNYRQAWAQLGLSDQFARHIGIYAKGTLGKFKYSIAANDPIVNALGSNDIENLPDGSVTYSGRRVLGAEEAGRVFTGYFEYQFLDQESNKLPYRVGSYLGGKRVFNVGAGFFNHGNGTVTMEDTIAVGNDVNHFSVDAYYDAPVGNGAMNAYVAFYNYDYGDNYALGTTYGTGTSFYGHFGYMLPIGGRAGRLMPYVALSTRDFDAFDNPGNLIQVGANWFVNGHNAKITLEYRSTQLNYNDTQPDRINGLILQTHIFL